MSVCKHQVTAFDQTRSDCGSLLLTSIGSTLCLKHVWNVDPCSRTRISFQHCVSNTNGLWFRVRVQASASCFLGQTRLDFGSLLCTSISLHPCPKHVLIMVPGLRTHQSSALCFECVWIVDPCLCTRIRLQPCSNTFDYDCLFVCPPARTKMKVTPELERTLHRARAPIQLSTFWERE